MNKLMFYDKDKHSKKPNVIPMLITRLVGDRKLKVELFGREKREGWVVYGDEVKHD